MAFSVVYIIQRFFYRFGDFFHHWYVDASRLFIHNFISFLEKIDRTFAVRITLRYLFQPLYKDYTVIGRFLGFIFRVSRIFIGAALYAFLTILFLAFYLTWLLVLPAVIFYAAWSF